MKRLYLACDYKSRVLEIVKATGYIVQSLYAVGYEDIHKYYEYP